MIQSRIREIRKERGLTLQQVAERAGTTAQTIGRLETGMRTLSIDWVKRIALALETDPSKLLSLPEGGDLEIAGRIAIDGLVTIEAGGTIAPRLIAESPVALRIERNAGAYREGDVVVCDGAGGDTRGRANLDRDCLVTLEDGRKFFARVILGQDNDCVDLVPIEQGAPVQKCVSPLRIAPSVMLLRSL